MIRFGNKVDANGEPISVKVLPEEEVRFIENIVERTLINNGFPESQAERIELVMFAKFCKKISWVAAVGLVGSIIAWISTLIEVKVK